MKPIEMHGIPPPLRHSRRVLLRSSASIAMLAGLSPLGLVGCAAPGYQSDGMKIGSATSRNVFVDASQFGNRRVKLRLRNSSGEPAIDMARMRGTVEGGLLAAGYQIAEEGFGILIDANLYFMNTVATGRQQASNDVGALLGGVAGYELAKGRGGVSAGSGALLGAIAGASLSEVLRSHNDHNSFLAVCDVNIGIVRQTDARRDSFVIGGNRFDRERERPDATFESFAQRETIKIYVYAGDHRDRRDTVMHAVHDRLARVLSNLI